MMLTEPAQSAGTLSDTAPPSPGTFIRQEILDRFNISQADLARAMDVSGAWLSQVLSGRNHITPEFALRLGKVTARHPTYWMNFQTQFDLYHKSQKLAEKLDKLHALTEHTHDA